MRLRYSIYIVFSVGDPPNLVFATNHKRVALQQLSHFGKRYAKAQCVHVDAHNDIWIVGTFENGKRVGE
jgi:hypothetical protein